MMRAMPYAGNGSELTTGSADSQTCRSDPRHVEGRLHRPLLDKSHTTFGLKVTLKHPETMLLVKSLVNRLLIKISENLQILQYFE